MTKIEELKIRMRSLTKAQVFAKVAAGEELMQCAVELLEQQEARIQALEAKPQLVGLEFEYKGKI